MKSVNISYFFKNPRNFPWEYMGWTYPVMGEAYTYLCSFFADYEPGEGKGFLKGKPSIRELELFARDNGGIAAQIVKFHFAQEKKRETEFGKPSAAAEVIEFLRTFYEFKKDLEERLNRDLRSGRIKVPDAALEENRSYYDW